MGRGRRPSSTPVVRLVQGQDPCELERRCGDGATTSLSCEQRIPAAGMQGAWRREAAQGRQRSARHSQRQAAQSPSILALRAALPSRRCLQLRRRRWRRAHLDGSVLDSDWLPYAISQCLFDELCLRCCLLPWAVSVLITCTPVVRLNALSLCWYCKPFFCAHWLCCYLSLLAKLTFSLN